MSYVLETFMTALMPGSHALRCSITAVISLLAAHQSIVYAEMCTRGEFSAVVDSAGSALRDLNADNVPRFQALLRQLKEKRGWDDATFFDQARPFVEDERIKAYDEISGQLLGKIMGLGSDQVETPPDCALLTKLRTQLRSLVATMKAKWTYMFEKTNEALAD